MAKTKVNKSAAIREYLSSNPDAKPKEIVAALKKDRIRVSPQMVSTIKGKVGSPKKRGRKPTVAANGHVNMDQLLAAKVFVQRCGSIEEARNAVQALAKLI